MTGLTAATNKKVREREKEREKRLCRKTEMCACEKQDSSCMWAARRLLLAASAHHGATVRLIFLVKQRIKWWPVWRNLRYVWLASMITELSMSVFEVGGAGKNWASSANAQIAGATSNQRFAYIANSAKLFIKFLHNRSKNRQIITCWRSKKHAICCSCVTAVLQWNMSCFLKKLVSVDHETIFFFFF